jgi:N6-adenosine-specific RNA methylase IME4
MPGPQLQLRGTATETGWSLPANLSFEEWRAAGEMLGGAERAVAWWIGDWWIYGEHRYGERTRIVEAENWTGPSFQTCANCAAVARKFAISRRREGLSFKHHCEVTALDPSEADRLLRMAEANDWPTRQLRAAVKQRLRDEREIALAEATRVAARRLGRKVYSVIYADPPWRFEPWSRETGMDRAADNHYPTMTVDEIAALRVPAAEDCVLYLWATAPMLPEALTVINAWGFVYKSEWIWAKDRPGTGYWLRSLHEPLLVATRGNVPAPPPGHRVPSVLHEPVGRHSEKPDAFADLIEAWFSHLPRLEMFARKARPGWDSWGNEAPR